MPDKPVSDTAADASFTLLDLVSLEDLQRMQDALAAATGVASIIVDTEGRNLTRPSNFNPVCTLVAESPEGRRRCGLSNERRTALTRDQQRPTFHQCLACGFGDAAAPIIVDGRHIADWLIGQCDIYRVGVERIRQFAREIHVDENSLADAYGRMEAMPVERFERLLDLLWQFARGISELGYRNLQYRRDLDQRQRIEEQLLRRERENGALLDALPDLVFSIRRDGTFLGCHGKCEELYVGPEQFIGKSILEVLPPAVADQTLYHLRRAFADGCVQVFEYPLTINGRDLFFEARIMVSLADTAVAVVRDVTERRRASAEEVRLRERLEKAERMESLGVLAGGVAHDLNNLLGPLVGYPELIVSKLPDTSPAIRYIESMRTAAVEASEVIQDLLTLSRRGRYEMTPVDLNEVVQACLQSAEFHHLAGRRPQVTVRSVLCESVAPINGSFTHLQKLVLNLLGNAYDAIDVAGEIVISTEKRHCDILRSGYQKIDPGTYVLLSVRDDGRGYPADELDKIFEPYYTRAKTGRKGTGLGLAVVYGVVKDHGGYYDVFSEVGRGSEFLVYFKEIISPVAAHPAAVPCEGRGERILVVDDVAAQRELAAEMLTGLGYDVITAADGHRAVELLAGLQVDLVVMDMIMEEGFDGLDTYREILKVHPRQKAIIVSGFASTDRVEEMQRLGAGDYVGKPYTLEVLGKAIRSELDRAAGEKLPARSGSVTVR